MTFTAPFVTYPVVLLDEQWFRLGALRWRSVSLFANTDSGKFLDHNVRVNSVLSSYRVFEHESFSECVGDLTVQLFPSKAEHVHGPFVAIFHK